MDFRINGTVVYRHRYYSAGVLNKKQERIVEQLRQRKWDRKRPVALIMRRTPKMLALMFALLQEHIAFLPLDLSVPEERLRYMLQKADVSCILSDVFRRKRFLGYDVIRISDRTLKEECSESITGVMEPYSESYIYGPEDIAYLLFTSGTTGYPKAVEISQRALANFVKEVPKQIGLSWDDRIGSFTGVTFDIFFLESIMSLNCGLTVVLADDAGRNNPKYICDLIETENITALQMTPSMLAMIQMVDREFESLNGIRVLMVGGESFPSGLLTALQKAVGGGAIYNMYGPTETTIWSSIADLTVSEVVHVGKPIANTDIYIVSDQLEVLDEGVTGEIAISGEGLARGYRNDEERTVKSFVQLTVNGVQKRAYLTGDLGYVDGNGNIFCSGRKDGQVKILGHRIELADIEENVRRINGVKNATVAVYGEGIKRLVCFYIADMPLEDHFLITELQRRLPDYMLPDKWIRVPEICYTTSRKTDRNAMIENYLKEESKEEELVFEHDEKDRATKMVDFLRSKGKKVSLDTEIKEILPDSIQYIEFMVFIEDTFDIEIEDKMLNVEYFSTLNELVRCVNEL